MILNSESAIADYKAWAKQQVCCDCGSPAADKTEIWVTETQCMSCFVKHGPPESMGKPSAADSYGTKIPLTNLLKVC